MPNPTVQAGRRQSFPARVLDLEHRPKPQQARLILTATTVVVLAGMLAWLLCWIGRPEGIDAGSVWIDGLARPVIASPTRDIERLTVTAAVQAGKASRRTAGAMAYGELPRALRGLLARAGSRPVVYYLAAPGVSDREVSSTVRAYLLPPATGPLPAALPDGAITADALLDLLDSYPNARTLLILDAGQVGSDRNLGVFANGFGRRLKEAITERRPRNLAILSACAPGQVSWASESDGGSVFAHYVARGLAGQAEGWDPGGRGIGAQRVTVRGLARYVRYHVSHWAWRHRQAIQTPELLGDARANFDLRKLPAAPGRPRTAGPGEPDVVAVLLKRLGQHWTRRDEIAAREPWGRAPLLWQRYQETALHAERLIRAGETAGAEHDLAQLDGLAAALDGAIRPAAIRYPSRAMARADEDPRSSRRNDLADAERADDGRLESLLPAEDPRQPAANAPGPKPAGPAPADGEVVPDYIEQQPIAWIEAYVRTNDAPVLGGVLGPVARQAVATRRAAEGAAAPEAGVLGWVAPLVEAGDQRRREAMDHLFLLDGESSRATEQRLRAAATSYDEARQDAELYRGASHLVRRIQAELPYYGEWVARVRARPSGTASGLEVLLETLLTEAASLAEGVSSPPRVGGATPAGRPERIEDLRKRLEAVGVRFDDLSNRFVAECRRLAEPAEPARWVEIDDVLRVPLIPAADRRALLERVRSRPVAGSLADEDALDQPAPGRDDPCLPPDLPASDASASSADPLGSSPTDPAFWTLALGLARLERGLLALGGAPVGALDEALDRAAGHHGRPSRFDDFEELSRLLRDLRARQLERVDRARDVLYEKDDAEIDRLLTAADRAARALPLADALAPSLKSLDAARMGEASPAGMLDRFRLASLLRWHGERLLQDFAPRHALRVLDEAANLWGGLAPSAAREETLRRQTAAMAAARAKARAMEDARLEVRAVPDQGLALDDWADQPLTARVEAVGDVPQGLAVALIDRSPADAHLTVTVGDSGRDSREGVGIPVSPGDPARDVRYLVARTTPEPSTARLGPVAFYRGRIFRTPARLDVALRAVEEPIAIALRTTREGLLARARGFGLKQVPPDQFLEHPNDGYVHFDATLSYDVVVRNNTREQLDLDVRIDDEGPGTPLRLGPGQEGSLSGNDVEGQQIPPGGPKVLRVDVAERDGRVKGRDGKNLAVRREFRFHVLRTKDYLTAKAVIVPDAASNTVVVKVSHLTSDLITWPTHVTVSAPGVSFQPSGVIHIPRGESCRFWGRVAPGAGQVLVTVEVERDDSLDVMATLPAPPAAPQDDGAAGPR